MSVERSTLRRNVSRGFQNFPGIFFLGAGEPRVTGAKLG